MKFIKLPAVYVRKDDKPDDNDSYNSVIRELNLPAPDEREIFSYIMVQDTSLVNVTISPRIVDDAVVPSECILEWGGNAVDDRVYMRIRLTAEELVNILSSV